MDFFSSFGLLWVGGVNFFLSVGVLQFTMGSLANIGSGGWIESSVGVSNSLLVDVFCCRKDLQPSNVMELFSD